MANIATSGRPSPPQASRQPSLRGPLAVSRPLGVSLGRVAPASAPPRTPPGAVGRPPTRRLPAAAARAPRPRAPAAARCSRPVVSSGRRAAPTKPRKAIKGPTRSSGRQPRSTCGRARQNAEADRRDRRAARRSLRHRPEDQGRDEIVVDGEARWVTSGYLATRSRSAPAPDCSMAPVSRPAGRERPDQRRGLRLPLGVPRLPAGHVVRRLGRPRRARVGPCARHHDQRRHPRHRDRRLPGAHAAELHLYDVIWRQHIWTPERSAEGWRAMQTVVRPRPTTTTTCTSRSTDAPRGARRSRRPRLVLALMLASRHASTSHPGRARGDGRRHQAPRCSTRSLSPAGAERGARQGCRRTDHGCASTTPQPPHGRDWPLGSIRPCGLL